MSLIEQIQDWAEDRRAELVDLIEYLKREKENGGAAWQGFDRNGNAIVKKDGKEYVVKAIGNTGIQKNSLIYKDETNSADWQSRKKEREAVKTKTKSRPNKDKGNLFYRADDQILLTTPGVGVIRYLAIQRFSTNPRNLRGYVANGSTSGSISFYDEGVYSNDDSRNCLASVVYGNRGFPGDSHDATVTTPGASVSGDPGALGVVDSGISFGPGSGSLSLFASGTFIAETYGSIHAQEKVLYGDTIEYISTPGGIVQVIPSSHADFYINNCTLVRSALINDILFLSYFIQGFDDSETSRRSSGYWSVGVGKGKEAILHVRIDTTDATAQYIYRDLYNLKGSWWLAPFNPETDSISDFYYFRGTESRSTDFWYVTCQLTFFLVNNLNSADMLQAICETAFNDDWISVLGASPCMADLDSATSLQRSYFRDFIRGVYDSENSIYFSELRKSIPDAGDYIDYQAYLADTDNNFFQSTSATIDSTTSLADAISLVDNVEVQDKQSLEPLVDFIEYQEYVVGNTLSVGPLVEMELPELPVDATLHKAVTNAFADNLGTFEVIFPAIS